MTRQQSRLDKQKRSASRRPGIVPGRRFALVLVLAGTVLAGWGGVAAGDDSVVSATVFEGGSGGRVATPSVSLQTLDPCSTYSGTNPIDLYPGASPFEATSLSWALGTVISCGLNIPLSNVATVQVATTSGAVETPLTSAQLSQASQWPSAPGALPLISRDGTTEDQNTYVRPWEGGSDENAADQVIEDGAPIAIVVTETGSSLTVNASSQSQSSTSFSFSATVTGPNGTSVPAANLSYSWSFGDGSAPSTSPTPTHSFQPGGDYSVTVQVTDTADGMDGNGHTDVQVGSTPTGGKGPSQTGGSPTTSSKTPTGPNHSKGTKSGSKPGKSSASSGKGTGTQATKGTQNTSTQGAANTSGTSGSTGTSPSSSPPGKSAHPASTAAHHHPAPEHRHPAGTAGHASVVSGRLISDIIPLAAAASPLVHAEPGSVATAPGVRRAVTASTSPLAALAAALAALVLFGLGARRELRWREHWRRPRLSS